MPVLGDFCYRHNAREAAEQDYEGAKIAYRVACETIDWTSAESVARYEAATERKLLARDRYHFHRFCG